MIINLRNLKRKNINLAMVDGVFDPLHDGHIEYFKKAKKKSKNLKLVCSCACDKYVKKKHPIFINEKKRLKILDAIKYLDFIVLNESSTANILQELKPKIYFKGTEWSKCLPLKETQICEKNTIKIVFINTKKNSSSKILKNYVKKYHQS